MLRIIVSEAREAPGKGEASNLDLGIVRELDFRIRDTATDHFFPHRLAKGRTDKSATVNSVLRGSGTGSVAASNWNSFLARNARREASGCESIVLSIEMSIRVAY